MTSSNLPFGDDVHEQSNGERIIFHNINGIKDESNLHQIMMTMKELQADIFGFAKRNRSINGGGKQRWTNITKKFFYYSRTLPTPRATQTLGNSTNQEEL
jgi:hypothetical protein